MNHWGISVHRGAFSTLGVSQHPGQLTSGCFCWGLCPKRGQDYKCPRAV